LLGIKLDWSCGANGVKAGADPVCAVDPAEPGYQGFAVGPGDRDVTVAQCDGDLVEAFGHRQEELGGAARPFEQVEPMASCAQHHQSGVNELTSWRRPALRPPMSVLSLWMSLSVLRIAS
jgi:hypothetical protein